MTQDEVNRTLRHMEWLRLSADEAESADAARVLDREYGWLWKAIEPYVMGSEQFTSPPPLPDKDKKPEG